MFWPERAHFFCEHSLVSSEIQSRSVPNPRQEPAPHPTRSMSIVVHPFPQQLYMPDRTNTHDEYVRSDTRCPLPRRQRLEQGSRIPPCTISDMKQS